MTLITPKLSEAPVDIVLMTGIGFAAGLVIQTNPVLTATVFAVSTAANYLFFELANRFVAYIQQEKNVPTGLTYAVTCASVTTTTLIAMSKLDILTRTVAALLFVGSMASLAARLRIIYN